MNDRDVTEMIADTRRYPWVAYGSSPASTLDRMLDFIEAQGFEDRVKTSAALSPGTATVRPGVVMWMIDWYSKSLFTKARIASHEAQHVKSIVTDFNGPKDARWHARYGTRWRYRLAEEGSGIASEIAARVFMRRSESSIEKAKAQVIPRLRRASHIPWWVSDKRARRIVMPAIEEIEDEARERFAELDRTVPKGPRR